MTNVSNNSVPFRTLSRDVLLMEKYHHSAIAAALLTIDLLLGNVLSKIEK